MLFAFTVTLHVVLVGSDDEGVSVKVLAGDAVGIAGAAENVRADPAGHSRLKASADAFTGSLNGIVIVESTATFVAPLAGDACAMSTAGGLSVPFAVTERSSMARPWSEPE